MRKASPRTLAVFEYVRDYQNSHGFSPSVREIADQFNYASPSVAKHHLDRLVDLGYITRQTKARAIRIIKEGN